MGDDDTSGIPGIGALLGIPPGPVNLGDHSTRRTVGFDGDKSDGEAALEAMRSGMRNLQARLTADGRTGGGRSVLLVLQGMEASGKSGVLKHAVGLLDPGGVRAAVFEAPRPGPQEHDFLWRFEQKLPSAGTIGVFDRSHYEDVLIAKVHVHVPSGYLKHRYPSINEFERRLHDSGITLVKCMLHVSPEEQRERLLARLERPSKQWKFDPADVDDWKRWTEYQRAYEIALEQCNTAWAPWYVIPADRKWYRNLAVASLLREALVDMGLSWPAPKFEVEEQRRRLEGQG